MNNTENKKKHQFLKGFIVGSLTVIAGPTVLKLIGKTINKFAGDTELVKRVKKYYAKGKEIVRKEEEELIEEEIDLILDEDDNGCDNVSRK